MAKILIVDDNAENRYLLRVILQARGHEVIAASNGIEALELGLSEHPQLVVTDILMPDMDGFSLCRRWTEDDRLRAAPLIFYTATYTEPRDEDFALDLGAVAFVRKPTDPAELVKVIEDTLASGRGSGPPSNVAVDDEEEYLRRYNAALVRKLERKVEQLDMTQASVEQATSAMIWLDSECRIDYVNQAGSALLGVSADDLIGRGLWEFDDGVTEDGWQEELWTPLRRAGALTYSTELATAGGERIPVDLTANFWERAGRPHAFLFVVDNRERRALEQRLRQSQRLSAMGHVAGKVAHDFNNLLTALFGFLDVMDLGLPADSKVRPDLSAARETTRRAANLIRELFAFGRQQELRQDLVDVNGMLEEFAPVLRQAMGDRATLELQLDPNAGCVSADREQLERVLLIWLNAADALDKGGTVTIATAPAGAEVEIAVADHGVGMDAATKSRIFEPFFTTKSPDKGTGLGLATAHGIIEQSGGRLEVESEVGAGTRIALYLPSAGGLDGG